MRIKNNEYGRTMLEMIMYLGILMCLTITIAGYMHKMMLRYKVGRTAQQIIDLKRAIIHYTAADESYAKISPEDMSKTIAVPLDMRTSSDSIARHALGGTAEYGPVKNIVADTDKAYDYMFYIRFNNIYQAGCIELVTQGQFYGDGSDLDSLVVNNTHIWRYEHSFYPTDGIANIHTTTPTNNTATGTAKIFIELTDALAACSDKRNNTITWIFS